MTLTPNSKLERAILSNCFPDALEAVSDGADANGIDFGGRSMLQVAERCGAGIQVVQSLLRWGADANQVIGKANNSLFHIAARRENAGFIYALLTAGVTPTKVNLAGETPLHVAATKGNYYLSTILLEYGTPIKQTDRKGLTAADRARRCGHTVLADFLDGKPLTSSAWQHETDFEQARLATTY
jgi:hypothetical protein